MNKMRLMWKARDREGKEDKTNEMERNKIKENKMKKKNTSMTSTRQRQQQRKLSVCISVMNPLKMFPNKIHEETFGNI